MKLIDNTLNTSFSDFIIIYELIFMGKIVAIGGGVIIRVMKL